MTKSLFMDAPGEGNDLAAKIDALRCDIVKSSLFPERVRIAKQVLRLVNGDPELKNAPPVLVFDLFNEAGYYFGEDVYEALKDINSPAVSKEDKVTNLQMIFSTYFDLRTLK